MGPHQSGDSPDGTVTEVEFRISEPAYPFVAASEAADCTVALEELVPQSSGTYLEFFSVRGAPPKEVEPVLAEFGDVEVRLVDEYESGGIFRFTVGDTCPAVTLADEGAVPRRLEAEAGEAVVVADVLPDAETGDVVGEFRERHPEATVVAMRERGVRAPMFVSRQLQAALEDVLTERQLEVLRTAYFGGYFDDPRRATGEELADGLGIAPSTFTEHLRNAEQDVLSLVFPDGEGNGPR